MPINKELEERARWEQLITDHCPLTTAFDSIY